jgi:hypothetical protein
MGRSLISMTAEDYALLLGFLLFSVVVYVIASSFIEKDKAITCPKCKTWAKEKTGLDSSGQLLPKGLTNIRRVKCESCGDEWDVYNYSSND